LQVAMKIGSYATEAYEPRQVRKKAAVSSHFRVPWDCLVRANCTGYACICMSNIGARPI